jgi:hypothetical protein
MIDFDWLVALPNEEQQKALVEVGIFLTVMQRELKNETRKERESGQLVNAWLRHFYHDLFGLLGYLQTHIPLHKERLEILCKEAESLAGGPALEKAFEAAKVRLQAVTVKV